MEKFELALNELDAAELASVMGGAKAVNTITTLQSTKPTSKIGTTKLAATFNEFDSK